MIMRPIAVLSFFLLTACAPPTAQIISTDGFLNSSKTSSNKVSSTSDTTAVKSISSRVPSSWELSGAIAARNARKSWSASINWLQQGANSYQIRMFGPLGSGSVLIQKHNGVVLFKDGPREVRSSNADELLNQQTGIRLPVNNLYYWVRGVPAPGAVQRIKRDANNKLISLHQDGYIINYLNYSSAGSTILPSQIKMQGHGVRIKLVVKQWKI